MRVDSIHAMTEQLKSMFPGRNLSPKIIRQSVISYWLNDKKIKLEDVQQMAGHKFPSSTEKYLKKDSIKDAEIINMFHPRVKMYKKVL